MAHENQILIRMYNIGFGDCFLLSFPAEDRRRKVLVDCGCHFLGRNKEHPFSKVLDELIADITEDGTPKIDLLVATHRHQDHVSGFENDVWSNVEVGEVWMPWTENYEDKKALEILMAQSKKAKRIHKLLSNLLDHTRMRLGLAVDGNEKIALKAKLDEIQSIKDFSENSLTNPEAMKMLHYGFRGGEAIPRKYLPNRDRKLNTITPDFLPGVTVYLMGPSFDKDVIRDMDPPANEQWFRMMESKLNDEGPTRLPFHPGWSRRPEEIEDVNTILSKRDRRAIASVDDDTAFSVVKALENSVNGTSLMMMFKVGKAFLLFPGDAQHGTWQSALKDDEWRGLLTRTNFYKVGHHGSHNATPMDFVKEVIPSKCRAMISVYPVKIFEDIPKNTLLEELTYREAEYVRSDKVLDPGDPDTFKRTDLYVDTYIEI